MKALSKIHKTIGRHLLVLGVCLSDPAYADSAITIYNNNFAVVKDDLKLQLKQGLNQVDYADMTSMVEADSVILKPLDKRWSIRLLEQQYLSQPLQQGALLDQYEGKTIDFLIKNGDQERKVKGKIIRSGYLSSNGSTPIVELDGKVRFGLPGTPLFPALSPDTLLKPSLRWKIQSKKSGVLDATLSYITSNLSWQADYNIVLSDEKPAQLTGWVSLTNTSGKDFLPSQIKLMAGDVNKTQDYGRVSRKGVLSMAASFESADVKQQSVDEFHLYSLPYKTALKDGETKQVQFVQSQKLAVKTRFVYDGSSMHYGISNQYFANNSNPAYGQQNNSAVWVMREFQNTKANGLGVPLPRGKVRFYRQLAQSMEFIGDNKINHTPKNEKIRVYSGNAFDVLGERKRTNFKHNKNTGVIEESFSITVKNRKDKAVDVDIVEHLQRWQQWSIKGNKHYRKVSASRIEWTRTIPADDEITLEYTVVYKTR